VSIIPLSTELCVYRVLCLRRVSLILLVLWLSTGHRSIIIFTGKCTGAMRSYFSTRLNEVATLGSCHQLYIVVIYILRLLNLSSGSVN